MIVTSLACGLQITCASPAAFAANLSPYQYNPKQPPVEVDLSVLDEVEAKQKSEPNPAPPAAESAEVSQPMALSPPATAPQETAQEDTTAANAPTDHTSEFLDKIMANHLPPGTKKKTVKAPAAVTPPAPVRKPAVPVAEAPKAEEKPAETTPAVTTAPAAVEAPKTEKKTEEKPAETQAAPVATPAEAKPSEEKPAGPVVRERRRKTSEADAPAAPAQAEMTVAFDKTSSELSPAAQKDLDTIIAKIKDMPDQRIQLRAYATDTDGNASNARRMALSRGLMVRAYLTEKGISPIRLDVRALGAEGDATPSDQVELVFVK